MNFPFAKSLFGSKNVEKTKPEPLEIPPSPVANPHQGLNINIYNNSPRERGAPPQSYNLFSPHSCSSFSSASTAFTRRSPRQAFWDEKQVHARFNTPLVVERQPRAYYRRPNSAYSSPAASPSRPAFQPPYIPPPPTPPYLSRPRSPVYVAFAEPATGTKGNGEISYTCAPEKEEEGQGEFKKGSSKEVEEEPKPENEDKEEKDTKSHVNCLCYACRKKHNACSVFCSFMSNAIQTMEGPALRSVLDQKHGKREATCLHNAARKGHTSCVMHMISLGADLHAKDTKGRTALDYAIKMDNHNIAILLKNRMED